MADDGNEDDRSQRRAIRSGGLADQISLSSVNAVLSKMLSVIRLFVPNVVYEIIHDGLYQFLIFFSFLLFSPKLGCLMLGYLLPIYTSILALHQLHELHSKIELWNSDQRDELITPEPSLLITNPTSNEMVRSRRKKGRSSTSNVLSPSRSRADRPVPAVDDAESTSWSNLKYWLKPLNMFSFHGADDLNKNERKRKRMHQEADHVLSTIVDRLKYWIVFAAMEWVYCFIGDQLGLRHYVPFWNVFKFALILWLQLPYVPYTAPMLYEYLIVPVVILDITQSEDEQDITVIEEDRAREERVPAVEEVKVVERKERVSIIEGVQSMVLVDERKSKKVPTVRRGRSVAMGARAAKHSKQEDEDSGMDRKSDRSDDEEYHCRR